MEKYTMKSFLKELAFVIGVPLLMGVWAIGTGYLLSPRAGKDLGLKSNYKRHHIIQYMKNEGDGRFSGPYRLDEKVYDAHYTSPSNYPPELKILTGDIDGDCKKDVVNLETRIHNGIINDWIKNRIKFNGRELALLDKPATLLNLEDVDGDGYKDIKFLTVNHSGTP